MAADSGVQTRFMEFLKSQSVAVISTVSSSGQPMSATIYFIVDSDFNFYFMTKDFSRKYKNLETNPQASLVVGTENIPVTAQIQGVAEKVSDAADYNARFEELKKVLFKNDFVGPIFRVVEEKNDVVIFKLTPSWIRWLDLREEESSGDFIQIMP